MNKSDKLLETIKLMIRYDIPVLLNGASSIGKSRSMISLAKKFRVKHQLLFIGSEKPENIEGLPKLQHVGGKLEYFKPYWFPNMDEINQTVKNGREIFERFKNENLKDFRYDFTSLNSLLEGFSALNWSQTQTTQEVKVPNFEKTSFNNPVYFNPNSPFKLTREIAGKEERLYADDIRDICSYLCTLLGYGNFWLVLDEIDKVEEFDIDKYAPLLHIVRERYLKGWNLVEINDTKGIKISEVIRGGDYTVVKNIVDNSIKNGQNLLDTRVISMANASNNIEEALFRRFVHVIVDDYLILDDKDITPEMANFKSCLIETGAMPDKLKAPPHKKLDDINLQWVFNFFIRMMSKNDIQGNYMYKDALTAIKTVKEPKGTPSYDAAVLTALRSSSLWKIIIDNFEGADLQGNILSCLAKLMFVEEKGAVSRQGEIVDLARKHLFELAEQLDSTHDIADKIIQDLDSQYPPPVDAKSKGAIRTQAIEQWVDKCQAYLTASTSDENNKIKIQPVSECLIPGIAVLIQKKLAQDKEAAQDTMIAVMKHAAKWWEGKETMGLSGDPDYISKIDRSGLLEPFGEKQLKRLQAFLGQMAANNRLEEIKSDKGLYDYIKKKISKKDIQHIIDKLKKHNTDKLPKEKAQEGAKNLETFFA